MNTTIGKLYQKQYMQEIKAAKTAAERAVHNEALRVAKDLGVDLDDKKGIKLEVWKNNNVSLRCLRASQAVVCRSAQCMCVLCPNRVSCMPCCAQRLRRVPGCLLTGSFCQQVAGVSPSVEPSELALLSRHEHIR